MVLCLRQDWIVPLGMLVSIFSAELLAISFSVQLQLNILKFSYRKFLALQVALLNLITISSTWARVIDVMDNEVCKQPSGV